MQTTSHNSWTGDDVAVDRSITELSGYSAWDDLVLLQRRRRAALAP